ncbi:hypothetical protein F66182_6028 [Fusarium sp. NRRL 66182]|nr:hypothetical protein F66182_6028 [Fusarium sp. NRRL 66182]
MDPFTEAFFSIFMIVWGFLTIGAIKGVCKRSATGFGRLRFWSIIPLAIYGPIVVLNPWWRLGRLSRGYQFLGIWITIWPILSCIVATLCKQAGSMGKWNDCQRSRGPFYILCVDLAIVFFSIVDACRYPIPTGTSDWTFGGGLGKIMRMFVILLFASQDALIFPIASFPRSISVPAIIIRRFFLPSRSKQRAKRWPCDMTRLLSQASNHREMALARMLQHDRIAKGVARQLHYHDLVNLSLTSKLMRTAVFYPSMDTISRHDRIESLCASACSNGMKNECWACERVICNDCKSKRLTIPSSRVKDHFTHCYAVCTFCYLFSAPGGPAPFHAKWNMQDLEMQHIRCCEIKKPGREKKGGYLCRHCHTLSDEGVAEVKEARDEFYLSRTLPRNVDCAVCLTALSRRQPRWWFCGKGRHECHWAGHHTY